MIAYIVNLDDMWVRQFDERTDFSHESLEESGERQDSRVRNFDHTDRIEVTVVGAIDRPHVADRDG